MADFGLAINSTRHLGIEVVATGAWGASAPRFGHALFEPPIVVGATVAIDLQLDTELAEPVAVRFAEPSAHFEIGWLTRSSLFGGRTLGTSTSTSTIVYLPQRQGLFEGALPMGVAWRGGVGVGHASNQQVLSLVVVGEGAELEFDLSLFPPVVVEHQLGETVRLFVVTRASPAQSERCWLYLGEDIRGWDAPPAKRGWAIQVDMDGDTLDVWLPPVPRGLPDPAADWLTGYLECRRYPGWQPSAGEPPAGEYEAILTHTFHRP